MITPSYVRTMARYNHWQNGLIYDLAGSLDDAARRADCGMCFGSIHNTLNHMLWDDQMLMHCLADMPLPAADSVRTSVGLFEDWLALRNAHAAFSTGIVEWADTISETWLEGTRIWNSGAAQQQGRKSNAILLVQLFNHQTHHRGQLHVMLSQQGVKTPHTDVSFMPEDRAPARGTA